MENQKLYYDAVQLGLLKFTEGETFTHRDGSRGKFFLVDSRGAGTNIPLRDVVLSALMETMGLLPECEVLAGIAKSGTVWASTLGYKLDMEFCNVLSEPRKAGLKRQVEGNVAGKKVMMIDNWTITGGSVRIAIEAIKNAGGIPVGVILVAHDEANKAEFGIPFQYAFSSQKLLQTAIELNLVPENLKTEILTINKQTL